MITYDKNLIYICTPFIVLGVSGMVLLTHKILPGLSFGAIGIGSFLITCMEEKKPEAPTKNDI